MNATYTLEEITHIDFSGPLKRIRKALRDFYGAICEATEKLREVLDILSDVWLEDRALPLRPPRKIFPGGLRQMDKRGDIRRRLRCVNISMQ